MRFKYFMLATGLVVQVPRSVDDQSVTLEIVLNGEYQEGVRNPSRLSIPITIAGVYVYDQEGRYVTSEGP